MSFCAQLLCLPLVLILHSLVPAGQAVTVIPLARVQNRGMELACGRMLFFCCDRVKVSAISLQWYAGSGLAKSRHRVEELRGLTALFLRHGDRAGIGPQQGMGTLANPFHEHLSNSPRNISQKISEKSPISLLLLSPLSLYIISSGGRSVTLD